MQLDVVAGAARSQPTFRTRPALRIPGCPAYGPSTVAVLVLVLGAMVLPGCGRGPRADLVVYSGRTQDLIEPLIKRFEDESGLSVEVRYPGDSAVAALQIEAEGDRSDADVFISQSPGAMGFLDSKGRLSSLPDAVIGAVAPDYRAADGHWVGTSGRVRVLVYNTNDVTTDELPDSVFDLSADQYRGRLGVAPTNSSFVDFVSALRELRGDEATVTFLSALVDNGVRTYANNDAILAAVARGEIDFGLVNHYYNERAKAEDPNQPTENHVFANGDPGSVVLVTTVARLATGDEHRGAAERFIEFLLNNDSQRYFASETLEYPLVEGVTSAIDDLPALAELAAPPIDLARLGEEFESTGDLIRDSGLADG